MHSNKILFILHIPGAIHGSSIVGLNYSKYIARKKDIIVNIQLAKDKTDIGRFSLIKLVKIFKQLFKIFISSRKVDKVVLFYTSSGLLLLRDIFIRLMIINKPIVLVMHNKGLSKSKVPNFLKRHLFYNSTVFILSNKLYFDIEKFVKKKDVKLVPNCLFQPKKVIPQKKSYKSLKFLFLSNLIFSKGIVASIKIVKNLIDSGIDASLEIVGSEVNVSFAEIYDLIVGYENKITVHGPLFGNDKIQILKKTNILLFPTRYQKECFPLVILESFAYSSPVISFDNGAISDLIENNYSGYVFDQNADIEQITNWIYSRNQDHWLKMSTNAYNEYIAKFSMDKWIKMTKNNLSI